MPQLTLVLGSARSAKMEQLWLRCCLPMPRKLAPSAVGSMSTAVMVQPALRAKARAILTRSKSLPSDDLAGKPPLKRTDSIQSGYSSSHAKDSGVGSDNPSSGIASDQPSRIGSD